MTYTNKLGFHFFSWISIALWILSGCTTSGTELGETSSKNGTLADENIPAVNKISDNKPAENRTGGNGPAAQETPHSDVAVSWDSYLEYNPVTLIAEFGPIPMATGDKDQSHNNEKAASAATPPNSAPADSSGTKIQDKPANTTIIRAEPKPTQQLEPPKASSTQTKTDVPSPHAAVSISQENPPAQIPNGDPKEEPRATATMKESPKQNQPVVTPENRSPDLVSQHGSIADSPDVDEKGTYTVKIPLLNARIGPSMISPVVRVLKKGDEIKGISREGIWVQTDEKDYVSINFLTPVSREK